MEMSSSFGSLARHHREKLGYTRVQLAHNVGCSAVMIYKIEIDERRPSVQLAKLLATHLALTADQAATFVHAARMHAHNIVTSKRAANSTSSEEV